MGCGPSKERRIQRQQEVSQRKAQDLRRPVEVPCPKCGAINYIEPRRHGMECFACRDGTRVSRNSLQVVPLPSAQELADKKTQEQLGSTLAERWDKATNLMILDICI